MWTNIKTVVVGGQGRKVGKTSVIAGLIRGLRGMRWTAVKVSSHSGRVPHLPQSLSQQRSTKSGFVLTEETEASIRSDTGRFLAAGAGRALWLRVGAGNLAKAMPALRQALKGERNVLIESSGILKFMTPSVCLFVLDRSRRDFKAGARRALARADAIVQVEAGLKGRRRPAWIPPGIPVFAVTRSSCFNSRLCEFVKRKLKRESNSKPEPPRRVRDAAGAERSRGVGTQQK